MTPSEIKNVFFKSKTGSSNRKVIRERKTKGEH